MTLHGIKKDLAILEPELTSNSGFVSSAVVDKLLGIFEQCYSIAESSAIMIQQLKDDVNRLKGEDGKPIVEPNRTNSYSTDKDRKAAETTPESAPIGFKLPSNKLDALAETRIPKRVLQPLAVIKNKKFSSEDEFIAEVTKIIGKADANEYRDLLMEYGRYTKRKRKRKTEVVTVDRDEECKIDKSTLPADAYFMEYATNVVQDIIITRDNVRFKKEVYYSPSQHKTFMASVPIGYEGEYGPGIKTEILAMKYINNMSEPKIVSSLQTIGTSISPTYVSNRLTFPVYMQPFIDEKNDLFKAALEVSSFIQIDDTGCRMNGESQYVQILCNEFFTMFFTTPRKDRLTILDILRNFESRCFIFNDDTFCFMQIFNVSSKLIDKIKSIVKSTVYDETQFNNFLDELFPDPKSGKNLRIRIAEAAAIAHYQQDETIHKVNILVADDAPQFKLLTMYLALCWIHIGRHIKKLNPVTLKFQNKLEAFQKKFWQYYNSLREFKKNPEEAKIEELKMQFDELFSTRTGYLELDKRIEKITTKKENLLTVLTYSEVPLHNNASENGARVQKRREDVSLQTRNKNGTVAKDAMMSIVESCKKLGINPRKLIQDRILQGGKVPRLADVIIKKAAK
ncbi:MAG: transposase [Victivallaceae bacterium]|nr:transposase [Victivallaceae bacterium]